MTQQSAYELFYWPGLPGRGEFVRLALEAAGIAYRDRAREEGAAALIAELEARLAERGVRVWFGNVTHDSDVDRLRGFYSSLGFTVLDEGQSLPPLLGKNWVPPGIERPAFYFYKAIRKVAGDVSQ